jgi:UTP-glucose-1-phosphate uridylyltransferase
VGNEPFAVVLPDVLIDDYESDHGEIQLTDTIGMLLESAPVEALV